MLPVRLCRGHGHLLMVKESCQRLKSKHHYTHVYYVQEEQGNYYDDFKESVEVIESYKKSRQELSEDSPDVQKLQKINKGVAISCKSIESTQRR